MKNAAGERNAGATIRKKMKMTMAATKAPTSGRPSSRVVQLTWTRLEASAGVGGAVLTGVLMLQLR